MSAVLDAKGMPLAPRATGESIRRGLGKLTMIVYRGVTDTHREADPPSPDLQSLS